jgi:hypothetical protein
MRWIIKPSLVYGNLYNSKTLPYITKFENLCKNNKTPKKRQEKNLKIYMEKILNNRR